MLFSFPFIFVLLLLWLLLFSLLSEERITIVICQFWFTINCCWCWQSSHEAISDNFIYSKTWKNHLMVPSNHISTGMMVHNKQNCKGQQSFPFRRFNFNNPILSIGDTVGVVRRLGVFTVGWWCKLLCIFSTSLLIFLKKMIFL